LDAKALLERVRTMLEHIEVDIGKWRRPILAIATLAFAAGIFLSLKARPDTFSHVEWLPLAALALVAVPATIVANSIEFILSGRLIGHKIDFWTAVETTIIGSVANLLPLPGGTIVRVAALKSAGANLKSGTSTTLFVAIMWFGVAFGYSGAWLVLLGQPLFGAAFAGFGLFILAACIAVSHSRIRRSHVTYWLIATKCVLVLIDAARILLSFLATGALVHFGQASVLTVASVLGTSVSIVPAGLGVREAVSAALGPVVGIAAASAFLATSLNRIVGLLISAPVAFLLVLQRKSSNGTPSTSGDASVSAFK
jgi:hypothetical protein